jgi:hypothetical protein
MQSKAKTVTEYLNSLPEDRKLAMTKLRSAIKKNLPKGFEEVMAYGSMGWVVPHSLYPAGYHCDPKQPLPFLGLASQKNYVSVYHMALYDGALLGWFKDQWGEYTSKKLDMGKCCVRFKKPEEIPFELIGELASKMTPQQWIEIYLKELKQNKK